MDIGVTIRYLRIKRGMTQKELSERLGVTESYVSQYERNKRIPKRETLQRICDALEITPEEWEANGQPLYVMAVVRNSHSDKAHPQTGSQETQPPLTETEKSILAGIRLLNKATQLKVLAYVEDLTRIPAYRKA